MQTPLVVNPINVLTNTFSSAKPESNAAPTVPFGQVFSREVSARQPQGEAKPAAVKQPPANTSANTPVKPADTPKTEAKTANKTSKTDGVSTTEKNAEASEDDIKKSDAAEAAANAGLLALVVDLSQIQMASAGGSQAAADNGAALKSDNDQALSAAGLLTAGLPVAGNAIEGMPTDQASLVSTVAAAIVMDTKTSTSFLPGSSKSGAAGSDQASSRDKLDPTATSTALPIGIMAIADSAVDSKAVQAQAKAATGFQLDLDTAQKTQQVLSVAANSLEKIPLLPDAVMAPVQQLAASIAQAMPSSDKLTAQVGTPDWDQALGQKIVWMVAGAQQTASLTLNPPDLGPLQVILKVTNDQANATFIAAQPEVREAIEAAMPRLREMMSEAGIQLGQANVSAQTQGQQHAFAEQQRQNQQHQSQAGSQFEVPVSAVRSSGHASGSGLVDTFA